MLTDRALVDAINEPAASRVRHGRNILGHLATVTWLGEGHVALEFYGQ
jgi:hypothetical protein